MISRDDIERYYNEYYKELFVYIFRYTGTQESAEDALQDTFSKLISYSQKKDVYPDNVRALLYTIARTISIDTARKNARRKETSIDGHLSAELPDTRQGTESSPLDDFLDDFIARLGEPEKTILIMRRGGMTFDEVSETTGIPLRTVKRKTAAVLLDVRAKLKNAGFMDQSGIDSDSGTLHQ